MKRCPQCNRVEPGETMKFCRVDGMALIGDSAAIDDEAGTIQLGSASVNEIETGILLNQTNADSNRTTAATTVLTAQPSPSAFGEFRFTTRTRLNARGIAVIGTAIVAAVTAVFVVSYRIRNSTAAIHSIAVMPFINESGNADLEYLSDGMTETLIGSLSQLPDLSVKARSSVFRYK